MSRDAALLRQWQRDAEAPFAGWSFERIASRSRFEGPSWSFPRILAERARGARSALDLGTGGGEQLSDLRGKLPPRTVATEAYAPNRRTAAEALGRLGIGLVAARASRLPFASQSFDLVSSRHTSYRAKEIARVLRPGGTFVTQQVGAGSFDELVAHFGAPPARRPSFEQHVERLERGGLRVERAEKECGHRVFDDVGALGYMLRNIPWLVKGFAVERHAAALLALQEKLEKEGSLRFAIHWYLLVAAPRRRFALGWRRRVRWPRG